MLWISMDTQRIEPDISQNCYATKQKSQVIEITVIIIDFLDGVAVVFISADVSCFDSHTGKFLCRPQIFILNLL